MTDCTGYQIKASAAKIQFYNPNVGYENLWATRIKENHYRIESIPFFIYGISLGDIVKASLNDEGELQFAKVVKPSKHRNPAGSIG